MPPMRLMLLPLLLVALGGCGAGSPAASGEEEGGGLTVSAAVSLREAFVEIGELYRARTGGSVSFNFGASGSLQKQIEAGAPVDVFASAGARQMDELAARGLIDAETRRGFARNTLVLVVPEGSQLNLTSLSDLAGPAVRRVAVGNPKTVPAGQYTEQAFAGAGLGDRLQPKLVVAEDVRQVLDYVARGEVDAGVVYATDAREAAGRVRVAAVAEEGTHEPITYPAAVVRDSRRKQAAREFVELVAGAEGQAVLRRHGFAGAGG